MIKSMYSFHAFCIQLKLQGIIVIIAAPCVSHVHLNAASSNNERVTYSPGRTMRQLQQGRGSYAWEIDSTVQNGHSSRKNRSSRAQTSPRNGSEMGKCAGSTKYPQSLSNCALSQFPWLLPKKRLIKAHGRMASPEFPNSVACAVVKKRSARDFRVSAPDSCRFPKRE